MQKIVAVAALMVGSAGFAQDWKPVEGRIMTQWAKEVDPKNPWPEYPRPTMVREKWQNLNGLWEYTIVEDGKATDTETWGKILVPFPVESALSGVAKRVAPNQTLWYMRTFTVPADWRGNGQRVMLNFGAVDWHAKVKVNGKVVGEHKGGYDPFSFDVTEALKDGANQVTVEVKDPTDEGGQPRGKQWSKPEGIWYTPTTGIWQTVWIEPVPMSKTISRVTIAANRTSGKVEVSVRRGPFPPDSEVDYQVEIFKDGQSVAKGSGPTSPVTVTASKPQEWTPEHPTLYTAKVRLLHKGGTNDGKVADEVGTYFAFRDIKLGKDENGINRLMLNGKPTFMSGPLDQGFWPDGLYTPPNEAAMKFDIEAVKKMGGNMLRKHVKVESERFYYACDQMGVMVWQDIPSPFFHDGADANPTKQPKSTPEWRENFVNEAREIVHDFGGHPSIVMWVPWNEGWGQNDQKWAAGVVDQVKRWDPTRLVNCASGWTDTGNGDVLDVHLYPGPGMPPLQKDRAAVLGEYGGLGLPVEGHTWVDKNNWGYVTYKNKDELTDAYVGLMKQLPVLIGEGLCAAVYTQTTDVEVECNGWLTYDRAVWKIDPVKAKAATMPVYGPAPVVKVLVARAGQDGAQSGEPWKYTTQKPADGWEKPGFDAQGWETGWGGFGTRNTPGARIGSVWASSDIWLRRVVAVKGAASSPMLSLHHDEDAEVYINGVLAASVKGYTSGYVLVPVSEKAAEVLRKEKSVTLAVHCHQTQGGQYIDVGIVDVVEKK